MCVVYLHNICKRQAGSTGAGGGGVGGGAIFSKPKKLSGQSPVWRKYTRMTIKMGSRSPIHSQIFASCYLCKLVQDYYKYRNSFNIITSNFKSHSYFQIFGHLAFEGQRPSGRKFEIKSDF